MSLSISKFANNR